MPAPLPLETRVRIASALVEGNSLRATARMVEVARGTVLDFALRLGEGCIRLHNRKVRGLAAHVIQMDEMWSYVQKKQARVTEGRRRARRRVPLRRAGREHQIRNLLPRRQARRREHRDVRQRPSRAAHGRPARHERRLAATHRGDVRKLPRLGGLRSMREELPRRGAALTRSSVRAAARPVHDQDTNLRCAQG